MYHSCQPFYFLNFLHYIYFFFYFAIISFFFPFCLFVAGIFVCFVSPWNMKKKNSMQSNENRRIKRNNGKCASRSLSCRHNRAIATDSRLRSVHNNNICLQLIFIHSCTSNNIEANIIICMHYDDVPYVHLQQHHHSAKQAKA